MIGTVEVTIRIRFNQDVTKQEVRNFIDEMDYEIKDTIGNVSIVDTEVISDDLDDRQQNDDETMATSPEEEAEQREIAKVTEDLNRRRGLYGPEYKDEKF